MKNVLLKGDLISPCGMNCGVCIAYLRDKKPCMGCRIRSENKPKHCTTCRIVNCEYLAKTETKFCFECEKFHCIRMKQLDLRYRKNYRTSLIENLKQIQKLGIKYFIKCEEEKWTCPLCGKTMSIHRDFCLNCKTNVHIPI